MANELKYALELASQNFTGPANRAISSTRRLKGGMDGVDGSARRGGQGMSSLTSKFKAFAATAGVVIAVAGAVIGAFSGIKSAVSAAMDEETTVTAFETLIGNAEQTTETLAKLKQLGASTPFEFGKDLAPAARSLIAFGESVDTVAPALSRIGDVASGVNAPLGEIAEVYGKAKVAGQLFSEDINQLTGRGIPVIGEFAKILGVSEGEIKKLASEGKITFPILDQAFRNLTKEGGKFQDMMQKQSATSVGMISTLKDNWQQLLVTIGAPINDNVLKPMLQEAMQLSQRIGVGVVAAIDIAKAAIQNGSLGEILSQTLRFGLGQAVNYGAGAFTTLGQILAATFDLSWRRIQRMFSADTWGQIGQMIGGVLTAGFIGFPQILAGLGQKVQAELGGAFNSIVAHFQAGLQFSIEKMIEGLAQIPGLAELMDLEGFQAGSFEDILKEAIDRNDPDALRAAADENIRAGMDAIAEGISTAGSGLKDFAADYGDDLKEAFKDVKFEPADIIDTSKFAIAADKLMKAANPEAYERLMQSIAGTGKEAEKINNEADQAADGLKEALEAAKGINDEKDKDKKKGEEGRRKIILYNKEDSEKRRLARRSDADKAKDAVKTGDTFRQFGEAARASNRGFGEAARSTERGFGEGVNATGRVFGESARPSKPVIEQAKEATAAINGKVKSAGQAKEQQDKKNAEKQERSRWDSVLRIEAIFSNLAVG